MRKKRKCLICEKEHNNRLFCSQKCHYKSMLLKRVNKKCIVCNKCFICKINSNLKFCSKKCYYLSDMFKKRQKKVNETNRKNDTGFYSISKKRRREITKKGHQTNERNRTGCWDSETGRKGGKAAQKILREKKLGTFYNSKLNRKHRLDMIKNRRTYKFNNIYFDSNTEREFAMNFHYQHEKLAESINCQVNVGSKFFDFKSKKYKCFIEFHPWDRHRTYKEYYNWRRKILNENGYEDYNLIVIN